MKGKKTGGRPAGVPNKATREIKELAQVHGPAMLEALVRLATGAESEQARVSAIKEVLDRAYGKSAQAVEGDLKLTGGLVMRWAKGDEPADD